MGEASDSPVRAGSGETDIGARIAARVRGLRKQRGMSLEGLAERSDVSRSMLSLIERAESSPTAVVLEKIATGLGVSLPSLFEDGDAPPEPVSRAAERRSWRDPESGYVRCNVSPPGFPSPIQIAEIRLPPRARVAYETGARDVPLHQQVWVQSGVVEVSLGAVTHRLSQGDCLAMRLDAPTVFRNPTSRSARYVVVIAGATSPMGRS